MFAGERGQLSYVNLSTDFRRKAIAYVGSSVGFLKYFFAFSGFIHGNVQAARNTRYTPHGKQNGIQVRPRYNVISGGWEKLCYSEVYVIVSWAHQYAICMSK